MMWSSSVNDGLNIDIAAGLAAAGKAASGDLSADVQRLAAEHNVVLCPAVQINDADEVITIRCRNVQVDLSSWSVVLLAVGAQKRSVELLVFNCQLSANHLLALGLVAGMGVIHKLTMEFCTGVDASDWAGCISALLGEGSMLQQLSLRGNRCSDDVAEAIALALQSNLQLKALNACRNSFSDYGASALLRALKFNNVLRAISLAENSVGDSACATVQLLLTGFEVRQEDEPIFVAAVDRIKAWNKDLKASNKKRAKEGLGELAELPPLGEPIMDEGVKKFQNSTLQCVDLSGNQSITDVGVDALRTMQPPRQPISLILRDVQGAELVRQSYEDHELVSVYS